MNAEPQKNGQSSARAQGKQWLKRLPKHLLSLVAHNWGWKLLALLLALCLWAGLITQDPTLTRERIFSDVKVSVIGTETLRRNGMIVLGGLEDEALVARLRADVPQREYNSVSVTSYNPRVDLSRVTEPGEQTLKILTTSTTTYGTVQSIAPDSVSVVVDEYITNYRVPVVIGVVGRYPTGYYGATPTSDPAAVAVSGPKSVVDRITRVYVDFDVSKLAAREGLTRNALPMRFTDAEGNDVESSLLEVTSSDVLLRTIIVQQQLYPSKSLPVDTLGLTEGEPAEGYRVTDASVSPASVLVAGDGTALGALKSIVTATSANVDGKSESFAVEVRLDRPDDVSYMSVDAVTISVTIEPVSITRAFDGVKLSVMGARDGEKTTLDTRSVNVHLTGSQNVLSPLRASAISAYVDVSGLGAGTHELPIQVRVEGVDMSSLSSELSLGVATVTIEAK